MSAMIRLTSHPAPFRLLASALPASSSQSLAPTMARIRGTQRTAADLGRSVRETTRLSWTPARQATTRAATNRVGGLSRTEGAEGFVTNRVGGLSRTEGALAGLWTHCSPGATMRDLNDLQFLAAVVEQRSISAAARVLGVPKSRVSRRITLLEERLGVRLLERSTRSLNLTDAGQQVYEHARAVVDGADAVEDVVLRMRAEPCGLVRISCPRGLEEFLFEGLPALLAGHPLLRVQVILTNRSVDLIEEGVDIALRVREKINGDAGVQLKKIGLIKKILVASPQLLAQVEQLAKPADLLRCPLLHQQEWLGPSRWTLTNDAAVQETIEFQPRLASGDYGILASAACAGVGVALLPRTHCRTKLASGHLVPVLANWGTPVGMVHLVFTSRRGMLPAVRLMIDFAADALRNAAE